MILDRIYEIICKPITIILSILLAVGSVVTFAIINNINESKANLVSNLDIDSITTDSETGKLSVSLVDYEKKQEEEDKTISEKLADAANPEKLITDNISEYIETRYNYNNGAESIKDSTLDIIQDYSTSSFKDYVIKSIENEKADKESVAEINKVFINGRDLDVLNQSTNELLYIYIVNINGTQEVLKFTVRSESGIWKLNKEEIITTLSEEIK